ncbi:MAG: ammonia monooxygenase [Thaumarchaeota archaeon]|nr:ammonia monooxygenase [Nitrososphaerota archaeon]
MKTSKAMLISSLFAIIVLSSVTILLENAWGHGVQAQLQSRFIRVTDETFSTQTLETGEEIEIRGTLISLVNRDTRAWLSVFSDSTNAGNRWEFLARDPPGNVFDISANSEVDYSLRIKALEAGVYHLHTQLNVQGIGPGLGAGQTVVVEGEPIVKPVSTGSVIYQSIVIAAGLGVSFATKPWQVI